MKNLKVTQLLIALTIWFDQSEVVLLSILQNLGEKDKEGSPEWLVNTKSPTLTALDILIYLPPKKLRHTYLTYTTAFLYFHFENDFKQCHCFWIHHQTAFSEFFKICCNPFLKKPSVLCV